MWGLMGMVGAVNAKRFLLSWRVDGVLNKAVIQQTSDSIIVNPLFLYLVLATLALNGPLTVDNQITPLTGAICLSLGGLGGFRDIIADFVLLSFPRLKVVSVHLRN